MREILFKAKRIDNGDWIEGYYQKRYDRYGEVKHYIFWTQSYTIWEYAEIDPETLCQYTGLKDKDGNRIWENDIFEFDDEVWESSYTSCGTEWDSWEVKNFGVVGYCDYSGRFYFIKYKYGQNSIEADLHENNDLDFAEFVRELKVCGNYIDNPELLERS